MSKKTEEESVKPVSDEKDATRQESEEAEAQQSVDFPQNDSDETALEQMMKKCEQAELEAQNARDDLLRVQAEMQNLRRRTEQDIEKAHKFGQEKFASELLTVMDNLERALVAASDSEDPTVKAIYEGVNLTLKSFNECFKKFHIEAVDPEGEPFDPQLHQAMSIQENPEVEPNTVLAVMQKGYTLHGRVIRPAMVMVSREGAGENQSNSGDKTAQEQQDQ